MILDLSCRIVGASQHIVGYVAPAYRLLYGSMWIVWFCVGSIIGLAILTECFRPMAKWICILLAVASLGIVLVADLLDTCLSYVTLLAGPEILLDQTWGVLVGMGLIALLARYCGPSIEHFLEFLTGRSRDRTNHLSAIESVDFEIPSAPKDFDPTNFFDRRLP